MSGDGANIIIILCTFPEMEQARQIGTALVERQLAGCVNLIPGVESIYRWEGKLETAGEVLAIFKTTERDFEEFERLLVEMHPYEVPEVLGITPEKVGEAYGKWIAQSLAV